MKKIFLLLLMGGFIAIFWKIGLTFPSSFLNKPPETTPSPVPTSTLDPLLLDFQNRYRTPREVILGLTNDYGFEYDYQFRTNYKGIFE